MATKYWRVGGTNTWSSTANWSTVSPSGATGAAIPVIGDDVVISNVGQTAGTINIGAVATAKLNSWTVIGGTWTVAGATQVNIAGTFDCQNVTWTNTGLLSLQGTGASYDITASGTTFGCPVTFNALNVASSSFNLLSAFTTGATQTTTLTAGTLILNNFTLTTGIFNSAATNVRAITFGTGNIALIHTTAATAVVSLANYTNFSCSGTGGFTSAMSVTRTFTFGSTGATNTNSPNLALTSGASVPTLAAGSWFNHLNFTGSTFTLATVTVNVNSLTLASGNTYTALTVNAIGTGTITTAGKTLTAFTVTHTGTTTLGAALSTLVTGTTTLTQGTLDLGGFTLTTGIFSSNTANTRSIAFGTGAIALSHTTAATTVLSMGTATGFTRTGTGGFTVAAMSVTRTFTFGSAAGGTTSNAPNLTFTTGASVATITSSSWFNKLDFGTTSFNPGTTALNLNGLTLSSSGTYTALSPTMRGTGNITPNGKTIAAFTVNSAGTTTVIGSYGSGISCTTFTRTAGTIDFDVPSTLICTNSLTGDTNLFAPAGTLNLINITCSTYTVNGTLTMQVGYNLTTTTSFVTATAFTYSGGTLTTPLFTQTSGTVTLGVALSTGVTGTYTLTAGTLNLADTTLTTGIFSSNNSNTRSIVFGSGDINLTHTTPGTTVLSMATATGFTWTGYYGFTVAAMSNTRTFTFGSSAGGTISSAPNLIFTTGASVATITSSSWFNTLDFGSTSFNPGTTALNLNGLTLSGSGTYTSLSATTKGTGNITPNGKTIAAFTVNSAGTTTLSDAALCTTFTMTAGTMDFGGFNLTCSSTATYTSGTLVSIGILTCTTFTVNGPAFDFTGGTINPSTSFVLTSGSFTYNGGSLGAVPVFTHIAGTVTFNASYSLTTNGTYTLTTGALILADGVILSTGIFSASNANTRSIAFGSASAGNIDLTHTTAATTVLNMGTVTGFTQTGPGGFTVADMSNARTFGFGTASGGTISNAPNLTFTTGASVATITTSGWFNKLDFGSTSFNPGGTALNLNSLTLSGSGTYTSFSPNMRGTGNIISNGIAMAALTINSAGTTTLSDAALCTTFTLTAGTMDFGGLDLTCSSTATYTSGTLVSIGILTCTTFTVNGPTFDFPSGTINPSTSFVLTSGSFTYGNGGTLGAVPTFTHTAGTVTFNVSYALTTNGTYTLTAGSLILSYDATLSTGIFSSSGSSVRSIQFGYIDYPGWIFLTHTTPGTTVLNMATLTGFTWTGFYGFYVNDMSNTRTFGVGSTSGGSASNAPNLTFNTGASVATITSGSWFKTLDFGATAFNPGSTSLYLNNLTLSGSGTYNSLSATTRGTGTIISNGITMGGLTVNHAGTTSQSYGLSVSTFTLTLGTMEFGGEDLTCSSTATYTSGTLSNFNSITCTTFTINGPTFDFTGGTINPSTSFVLTSGSFTYNGGSLGSVPAFIHTAGTVTFNASYSLTVTGTYTHTAGSLILADAVTLYTGAFSSNNANTRSIAFGSASAGNINLTHTTAATTVLNMGTVTGFTQTGPGGFTVDDMNNTRTFGFGSTTGGSISNAPNLAFASGSSVATITTGSWFKTLDFGGTDFNPGTTTLNLNSLTLSGYGTYTSLTAWLNATGTVTTNERTFFALQISHTGTTTLVGTLTLSNVLALTNGTLACSVYNMESLTFASTGVATRSITGSGTYTVTGSGATAFSNASATGITMSGFTISMTNASAKTFAGGGGTYPTLDQGGAGTLTITGNNSFANLTSTTPSTITFSISTTQTFTAFNVSPGTTINSSVASFQATLSKSSGTVSVDYLSIRDTNATGGADWYAGANSTNVSNNTGWIFTAPPAAPVTGNFFLFF